MQIIAALFVLFDTASVLANEDYIHQRYSDFESTYMPAEVTDPAEFWVLPFETTNRRDINTIRQISKFGAYRSSYIKGHIHTGSDIVPESKSTEYVWVYPIGTGVVCSIHLDHPHITVVIKHKDENGKTIYSSYKHLYGALVSLGESVNINTKLGRLYTPSEAKQLNGNYDHLHLEIRMHFDDLGVASWATMTMGDLNKRFIDPLEFFNKHL